MSDEKEAAATPELIALGASLGNAESPAGGGAAGGAESPAGGGPAGADPAGGGAAPNENDKQAAFAFGFAVAEVLTKAAARSWPGCVYTEQEKLAVAAVLAPVFLKWTCNAPWMVKYREEIAAAGVVGGLALKGYQQHARTIDGGKPAPAGDAPAAPSSGTGKDGDLTANLS